jgi:hypothetical protein
MSYYHPSLLLQVKSTSEDGKQKLYPHQALGRELCAPCNDPRINTVKATDARARAVTLSRVSPGSNATAMDSRKKDSAIKSVSRLTNTKRWMWETLWTRTQSDRRSIA